MRIGIITIGSRGDVQPYIALGAGLKRAGYEVRLLTHGVFADAARAEGLEKDWIWALMCLRSGTSEESLPPLVLIGVKDALILRGRLVQALLPSCSRKNGLYDHRSAVRSASLRRDKEASCKNSICNFRSNITP